MLLIISCMLYCRVGYSTRSWKIQDRIILFGRQASYFPQQMGYSFVFWDTLWACLLIWPREVGGALNLRPCQFKSKKRFLLSWLRRLSLTTKNATIKSTKKKTDKSPNNIRYQQKTTNLPTIKLSQTVVVAVAVLVGTWWYWVSIWLYSFVLGGTGSV